MTLRGLRTPSWASRRQRSLQALLWAFRQQFYPRVNHVMSRSLLSSVLAPYLLHFSTSAKSFQTNGQIS